MIIAVWILLGWILGIATVWIVGRGNMPCSDCGYGCNGETVVCEPCWDALHAAENRLMAIENGDAA